MYTVTFNPERGWSYDHRTKTILVSEKDLGAGFATEYEVVNPNTGTKVIFTFTHSTGPEFDPKTKYVYKAKWGDSLFLEVANDPAWTREAARNYLQAKLRK